MFNRSSAASWSMTLGASAPSTRLSLVLPLNFPWGEYPLYIRSWSSGRLRTISSIEPQIHLWS
jgi:hypothetical protein